MATFWDVSRLLSAWDGMPFPCGWNGNLSTLANRNRNKCGKSQLQKSLFKVHKFSGLNKNLKESIIVVCFVVLVLKRAVQFLLSQLLIQTRGEKRQCQKEKWNVLGIRIIKMSVRSSCFVTVEALLTDTLVSGQLYLRPPCLKPRFNSHTNSVFLHSRKRTFP